MASPEPSTSEEERRDELVVRRPEWMSDERWSDVARRLTAAGWEREARG